MFPMVVNSNVSYDLISHCVSSRCLPQSVLSSTLLLSSLGRVFERPETTVEGNGFFFNISCSRSFLHKLSKTYRYIHV